MTVYVDQPVDYGDIARRRGLRHSVWAHLTADNRDELHAFAARLGLRRTWFQDHPVRWHYDITAPKHATALRLGAHPMTRHKFGAILAARRAALTPGSPPAAHAPGNSTEHTTR